MASWIFMQQQQSSGRDPDRLPDSTDPSGPCPRCGRPSNFEVRGSGPVTFDGGWIAQRDGGGERTHSERVSILECSYCQQNVVVVEERLIGGARTGKSGNVTWRGMHWWPTPGAGMLDDAVDPQVASAYDEGVRCLSAGAPNGAAAMFRNAITYIVEDKGSAAAKAKPDLQKKIKQMTAEPGPLGALSDWADHVRLYGNAGAHPDKFGEVTVEEAEDIRGLVRSMIDLLYEVPARIARQRVQRGLVDWSRTPRLALDARPWESPVKATRHLGR